jgi:hypothetical protein
MMSDICQTKTDTDISDAYDRADQWNDWSSEKVFHMPVEPAFFLMCSGSTKDSEVIPVCQLSIILSVILYF